MAGPLALDFTADLHPSLGSTAYGLGQVNLDHLTS